jgi:hypothetical protein
MLAGLFLARGVCYFIRVLSQDEIAKIKSEIAKLESRRRKSRDNEIQRLIDILIQREKKKLRE